MYTIKRCSNIIFEIKKIDKKKRKKTTNGVSLIAILSAYHVFLALFRRRLLSSFDVDENKTTPSLSAVAIYARTGSLLGLRFLLLGLKSSFASTMALKHTNNDDILLHFLLFISTDSVIT